jgi:hypothetical protein
MKSFGRLLMAAALIVPAGVALAPSAGASGGHFACTGTDGAIKVTPGLTLSQSRPQRYQGAATGLTCTGGFVSGGSLAFNANSGSKSERCSTLLHGRPQHGQGTITWARKDKAGKSQLLFVLTWTSPTGGTLTGTVRGTSVAAGKALTGSFTSTESLKSVNAATPGNCSVKKPITAFTLTAISLASAA